MPRSVRICTRLAVAALAIAAASASALPGGRNTRPLDTVETANGRTHSGHVVHENGERVVLRTGTRLQSFARGEIVRVESAREALRLLLVHLHDAQLGHLEVLKEIAQYAERHALERTARLMWWRALLQAPDDEETNRALGNRRKDGRWEVAHEGRWWTLADLQKRTRNWNDAWEFSSLHFQVRTNLDIHDALDLAFDLEHFYYGFYAFFRDTLELHELLEPIEIQIHADDSSFPAVARGSRSYFSPSENIAYINTANGIDRGTLLHEASHAILHNIAKDLRRAEIPAWIDEGLAEYLRAGGYGPAGRLRLEPGSVLLQHFRVCGDEEPRLSKVLNYGKGDYLSGSDPDLKYAQSYTLVDFLLHGQGEELRATFFEFIGWTFEGRSSSTHFKKKFEVDEEKLEQAWTAFVEDVIEGGARKRKRRVL